MHGGAASSFSHHCHQGAGHAHLLQQGDCHISNNDDTWIQQMLINGAQMQQVITGQF